MHWTTKRAADQGARLDLNMLRFAEMPLVSRRAPENEVQRIQRKALPVPATDCQSISPCAPVAEPKSRAKSAQEIALSNERKAEKLRSMHQARMEKEAREAFKNGPVSAPSLAASLGICNQSANLKIRTWKERGLARFLEARIVGTGGKESPIRTVHFFEQVAS